MRHKEGQLFYFFIYLFQWTVDVGILSMAMSLSYYLRTNEIFFSSSVWGACAKHLLAC